MQESSKKGELINDVAKLVLFLGGIVALGYLFGKNDKLYTLKAVANSQAPIAYFMIINKSTGSVVKFCQIVRDRNLECTDYSHKKE